MKTAYGFSIPFGKVRHCAKQQGHFLRQGWPVPIDSCVVTPFARKSNCKFGWDYTLPFTKAVLSRLRMDSRTVKTFLSFANDHLRLILEATT